MKGIVIIKKNLLFFFISIQIISCTQYPFEKKEWLDINEFYSVRLLNAIAKTVSPSAGNSGKITIVNSTSSSIEISWSAGSDNTTSMEKLKYSIYLSTKDNISTVSDIKLNGSLIVSENVNITSTVVNNLTNATRYYFNIILTDQEGNQSSYTQTSQKTKDIMIKMFIGGQGRGNFKLTNDSSRYGINQKCNDAYNVSYSSQLSCDSVIGFISIDDSDEIRDIPTNYSFPIDLPIVGINQNTFVKTTLATDWSDILDGTIAITLDESLGFSTPTNYWTGSYSNGILTSDHCSNFTSLSSIGTVGSSSLTDSNWMLTGTSSCGSDFYYLCLCY